MLNYTARTVRIVATSSAIPATTYRDTRLLVPSTHSISYRISNLSGRFTSAALIAIVAATPAPARNLHGPHRAHLPNALMSCSLEPRSNWVSGESGRDGDSITGESGRVPHYVVGPDSSSSLGTLSIWLEARGSI